MDVGDSHNADPVRAGVDLMVAGFTFVPRLVARTVDQVVFAVAAAEKLSCLRGREGAATEPEVLADVVPIDAARGRGTRRPVVPAAGTDHPPKEGVPVAEEGSSVDDLPIPSYDELAASQVVPRLASLSPAERRTIRDYEAANRGRRTILGRLDQLADER